MRPEDVNHPDASDRVRREDAETALRAFFETSLVEASDARDPIGFDARFAILTAAQRHALDRQLADVGSSNLLRGLVLTRAGLLGDAEHAFAALAAENRDSAVASQLLTAARKLRGRDA